jgi:hypothetical protein
MKLHTVWSLRWLMGVLGRRFLNNGFRFWIGDYTCELVWEAAIYNWFMYCWSCTCHCVSHCMGNILVETFTQRFGSLKQKATPVCESEWPCIRIAKNEEWYDLASNKAYQNSYHFSRQTVKSGKLSWFTAVLILCLLILCLLMIRWIRYRAK